MDVIIILGLIAGAYYAGKNHVAVEAWVKAKWTKFTKK